MKQLALIIMLVFPVLCWSQNTKTSTTPISPTNLERVGVDYEIKNNPNPDPDKIVQLNLNFYDSQRQPEVDVEIYDATTDYIIIVYSATKATLRKNQHNLQPTHEN